MPMRIPKPALVVVDVQEHFREIAEGIVGQVNDAIALAREHNIPIYYSQHGHPNPATDHNHNVLVAYLGASNSIKKDSPAYQLLPELTIDPSKGDFKIEKTVYDAFLGTVPSQATDLAGSLRDKGCNGVIVVGVCTNLCSETTARAAVCRGFGMILVRDANATYTKGMHDATIANLECATVPVLEAGFGEAITLDEVKLRIAERGLENAFCIPHWRA